MYIPYPLWSEIYHDFDKRLYCCDGSGSGSGSGSGRRHVQETCVYMSYCQNNLYLAMIHIGPSPWQHYIFINDDR